MQGGIFLTKDIIFCCSLFRIRKCFWKESGGGYKEIGDSFFTFPESVPRPFDKTPAAYAALLGAAAAIISLCSG